MTVPDSGAEIEWEVFDQCASLSSIVSNIQRHARECGEEKEDWLQFCHSVTIV